jgi:lysyl-tRNA synthetase class 2
MSPIFANSWQPTARTEILQRRAALLWSIRQFFHDCDMAEVHTPILSHDTVIDRHIDPVCLPGANLAIPATDGAMLYLQTSPEFCMKRLMAAGMKAIYQVAPVFRAGERGTFHNPEFTMVEWYRVGDRLSEGIQLLSDLVKSVLKVPQVDLLSYQQAFQLHASCDPLSCTVEDLADAARALRLGVSSNWSDDRDDWLNLLFAEAVQPRLGWSNPVIVTHYPATQSALARQSAEDERTAERFELFINGIELANGYHELVDAGEFERRNQTVSAQRAQDGKPQLPDESRLLAAMRDGLPACSGCALGFDRLVMVATGAKSIDEVMAFPIERA